MIRFALVTGILLAVAESASAQSYRVRLDASGRVLDRSFVVTPRFGRG